MVNMFKSIRRLHFLKGLSNDGIIFSSGSSNWIQIFRRCSGLMGKKNDPREEQDDLTFTAFLRQRQLEARRSIIVQITNWELWEEINKLCSDSSYVNKIFHYTEQGMPLVLIEMASEDKLNQFLEENHENQNCFKITNHFLKLKEPLKNEEMSVKKLPNFNKYAPGNKINKSLLKNQDNVSECLFQMFSDLCLNDLGVRLRFLMCRQIETLCAGFLPNAVAYPFGSSMTGFGANGCDLDIALVPIPPSDSNFQFENYLYLHKVTIQEHITVMAELMKLFLVGCSELILIRNAKVPIVKYKNAFTNVECDLSLYNMHGVSMSQLLYTLSLIDYRVRPLIIALKFWAQNTGLVNKFPGRTISNFQLTLLAIFYLQYTNLLPPCDSFPIIDGILFNDENYKAELQNMKLKAGTDTRPLSELYYSFFSFYGNFDFKKYGICVKSGKVIKNSRKNPLHIENPLIKGVNVSANVDHGEIQKLRFTINAVSHKIPKSDSASNIQNNINESRI